MSTTTELSENSHQGFGGLKTALCRGSTETKSNTASGLPVCLWQEGIGSRCSGKERDETNLDYFGARYFSGAMGRFSSPDPLGILKQKFMDPQQWNMYAYARNNPLLFVDPTGMYIVNCAEDDDKCNDAADEFEKQRKRILESDDYDSDAKAAAKAWGDRGEDNRISVTFVSQDEMDKAAGNMDNSMEVTGMVTPSAGEDHKGSIEAIFSRDFKGTDLRRGIAHEGSHIIDDFKFLKSYNDDTKKYNPAMNFTVYDTETRAYTVGHGVKPIIPATSEEFQKALHNHLMYYYPNNSRLYFSPTEYPQ